jgi:hypothetical protein
MIPVIVVASGCFAAITFGLTDALLLLVVWSFGPLCGRCFAIESVLARLVGGCFDAISCLAVWPLYGRCFATENVSARFVGGCFATMVTRLVGGCFATMA